MAGFGDCRKPQDIKKYLLDVISRGIKNGPAYMLYHYTSIDAVVSMIDTGYIWLGPTSQMNDYLEMEYIRSANSDRDRYFCCFSKTEENLAMYKMYTPSKDGVMIAISYETAREIIRLISESETGKKVAWIVRNKELTEETVEADIYWTDVCYKDLHSDVLKLSGKKNTHIKHPLVKPELAGFLKLYGWEYEKEVRLCADPERELNENERIAIPLPEKIESKIIVTTEPGFDKQRNRKKLSKLKRLGVTIRDSEYDALVDLKFDESQKTEIEDENAEKEIIEEYRRLRRKALNTLGFYANVYTNIVTIPDEEHEQASKELRSIGIELQTFTSELARDLPKIPSRRELKDAGGEFIGLSNSMYIYKGGDFGRLLDDNIRRKERIEKILKLE